MTEHPGARPGDARAAHGGIEDAAAGAATGEPAPDERLARPVATQSDVAALPEADRRRLAHWVSSALVTERLPSGGMRRFLILTGSAVAALFLVPWIVLLALELPNHIRVREWSVAWVGFDVAMLLSFAATAWFGWRRRQLFISALLVTAVLLCCDAWFDVTLSWGTKEGVASILTALFAEIPAAIILVVVYRRVLQVLVATVRHERGDFRPMPPLWRQRILVEVDTEMPKGTDGAGPGGVDATEAGASGDGASQAESRAE